MKLIGLTGGVGMGKSTSARLLVQQGCPVVDTDQIARDVVEPGEPATREIADAFGGHMLNAEGGLRRDELAKCVFEDESQRRVLERILHPLIRARWETVVDTWRQEGKAIGVVVIPLLFETKAEGLFDKIVCVACSELEQKERLRKRGWDDSQIAQRIEAQWPVAQKMDRSDYVIWSEGSLELHAEQVARIWSQWA